MFSRRTRARIVFVINVLLLPLNILLRRRISEIEGTSVSIAPPWLVAGGVSRAAYYWAHDRDLSEVRTNRWRRVLFTSIQYGLRLGFALGLESLSESDTARRSFMLGESIGHIVYRLWYGVLRPLPGTDD